MIRCATVTRRREKDRPNLAQQRRRRSCIHTGKSTRCHKNTPCRNNVLLATQKNSEYPAQKFYIFYNRNEELADSLFCTAAFCRLLLHRICPEESRTGRPRIYPNNLVHPFNNTALFLIGTLKSPSTAGIPILDAGHICHIHKSCFLVFSNLMIQKENLTTFRQ